MSTNSSPPAPAAASSPPPKPPRPPSQLVQEGFSFASALKKKDNSSNSNTNASANNGDQSQKMKTEDYFSDGLTSDAANNKHYGASGDYFSGYYASPTPNQEPIQSKGSLLATAATHDKFLNNSNSSLMEGGGAGDASIVTKWEEMAASAATLGMNDLLTNGTCAPNVAKPPVTPIMPPNPNLNAERSRFYSGDNGRSNISDISKLLNSIMSSNGDGNVGGLNTLLYELKSFLERELIQAGCDGAVLGSCDVGALARKIMVTTRYFSRGFSGSGGVSILDFLNYNHINVNDKARDTLTKAFLMYYDKVLVERVDEEFFGDWKAVEQEAKNILARSNSDSNAVDSNKLKEVLEELSEANKDVKAMRLKTEQLEQKIVKLERDLADEKELRKEAERNSAAQVAHVDSGRSSLVLEEEAPPPATTATTEKAKKSFVRVMGQIDGQVCEFRASASLAVSAVAAIYPGAVALKYDNGGGVTRVCEMVDGAFMEPDDGWGERTYVVVAATPTAAAAPAAVTAPRKAVAPPISRPQQQQQQQHQQPLSYPASSSVLAPAPAPAAAAPTIRQPPTATMPPSTTRLSGVAGLVANNPISATQQYHQQLIMAQYMAALGVNGARY